MDPRKYAIFLLSRMNYHSSILKKKMEKKGFSGEEIAKVMADCKRMGLIDDEGAILRELRRGYGPRYIEYKLGIRDVRRVITRAVQKKRILELVAKFKDKQKAYRTLARKGFDSDILIEIFSLSDVPCENGVDRNHWDQS